MNYSTVNVVPGQATVVYAQPVSRPVLSPAPPRNNNGIGGAVCGAIVGCLIAGPVGAVIGGGVGLAAASNNNRNRSTYNRSTYVPAALPQPAVIVNSPAGGAVSVRLPQDAMQWRGGFEGSGTLYFSIDVHPQDGGAPWRVQKRYNEFFELNARLHRVGPLHRGAYALTRVDTLTESNAFPRKHMSACTGAKLAQRRLKLEQWLQRVLSTNYPAWTRPLQDFLETFRYQPPIQAAPIQAAPQIAYAPAVATTVSIAPPAPAVALPVSVATPAPVYTAAPLANYHAHVQNTQPAATGLPNYAGAASLHNPTASRGSQVASPKASAGEIMEVEVPAGVQVGQVIGITVPDGRQATLKVPEGSTPGKTLRLFFDPVTGTISTLESGSTVPPPATQQAPGSADGQLMLVHVPAGVSPGQLLGINVPDGRQINVAVPSGAVEGAELELWFDAVAGTLTVL